MLIVAIAVVGVASVAVLAVSMSRRQDRETAIGMLSRETRARDRGQAAVASLANDGPVATGREVERAAALEHRGWGAAVAVAAPPRPVPAPYVDEETLGVTRRQFLNRSILGMFGLAVAGFGATVLGFLWPPPGGGGFGSRVNAGKLNDINAYVAANEAPFYVPEARTYLQPYPVANVSKAKKSGAYADPVIAGMELGLVALYQKCPHLGCRVPWCASSQWFECPCHGSQYNRVGEKKGGPAPRGMDRFGFSIGGDGTVTVDTSKPAFLGPPIGTNTTGQEAEGPHCR